MDLHLVSVGYFQHDGNFAEYDVPCGTTVAQPRLRETLDRATVRAVADRHGIQPGDWKEVGVWYEGGYLVLDLVRSDRKALAMAATLATEHGCDLVVTAMRIMSVDEMQR